MVVEQYNPDLGATDFSWSNNTTDWKNARQKGGFSRITVFRFG
jgi:hypothetical protein